jgi:membrane protein involved in D-alanine export
MVPFSSIEFFVLSAAFVLICLLLRKIIPAARYKFVLAALNASYLIFLYPKPMLYFGFIAYSFIITYLLVNYIKPKNKLIGVILLLLPMLFVKLDIRVHYYPFHFADLISFAGLSYATFRTVSYYMDHEPGNEFAQPVTYFNFLAFTPTLLIGPIDRYRHFSETQENATTLLNSENVMKGWDLILKGVVYKYIIAEIIDRYWLNIFPSHSKQLLHMLSEMYAYYAYLFFDFAGYSLMAIGIAIMMGMIVPENFRAPFLSVNPQDFWRRFHITLGDWLKDYFFSPLYMFFSRKKSLKKHPLLRQNISIFLTFFLMGCWNGFSKNYMISGSLFGLYSVIHNTYLIECRKKDRDVIFGDLNPSIVRAISIFIMTNAVSFSLYIFSGRFPFL